MNTAISDEHLVTQQRLAARIEQVYSLGTASGTMQFTAGAIGGGSTVHIGDIVKITEGPLVGLLARLASRASGRVLVVVELPGGEFDLEMALDWIKPATPEPRSISGTEVSGT